MWQLRPANTYQGECPSFGNPTDVNPELATRYARIPEKFVGDSLLPQPVYS
jgi:hypothetical protein